MNESVRRKRTYRMMDKYLIIVFQGEKACICVCVCVRVCVHIDIFLLYVSSEGKGYPLQYSGLENSMGCIVQWVSKSQTDWETFTFTFIALSWSFVLTAKPHWNESKEHPGAKSVAVRAGVQRGGWEELFSLPLLPLPPPVFFPSFFLFVCFAFLDHLGMASRIKTNIYWKIILRI